MVRRFFAFLAAYFRARTLYDVRRRPWLDEPNLKRWSYGGLDLVVVRNALYGNLCGFVKLPKGHRDYGKDWSELYRLYRVHGGLDFSGRCIYHLPTVRYLEPVGENIWWIGFSCNGGSDIVPREIYRTAFNYRKLPSYKDFVYVSAEAERLADQVIARA